MIKKLLVVFLFTALSIASFAQAINVSGISTTNHFDPNWTCSGCNMGLPTVTATLQPQSTGVTVVGGQLICNDPCGTTVVRINLGNVRWTQGDCATNVNWIHGLWFPAGLVTNVQVPVGVPNALPLGWAPFPNSNRPAGATGACSAGLASSIGFYYDGTASHSSCSVCTGAVANDGIPYNNWGDGIANCNSPAAGYNFYFDMTFCNSSIATGLVFRLRGTADGGTGCWQTQDPTTSNVQFALAATPCTTPVFTTVPTPTVPVTYNCATGLYTATLTAACGNGQDVTWWSASTDLPTPATLLHTGSPWVYTSATCPTGFTAYAQCCPAGNTCSSRKPSTLGACPPAITLTNVLVTQPTCTTPTGSITGSTVTNGTPPYTYTLTPGGATNSTGLFGGLAPGSYTLTVTDAGGCSASAGVTINPVTGATFTPSATTVAASCPGASDGSINVTVVPAGSYTFTLDGNATTTNTTGNFPNVSGGAHTVTVANATCNTTINVNVVPGTAPAAPTATSPINYCQNATATPLTATGTGLLWYTAATGGTGNGTAPTPSTATPGSTTYYVSQTTTGPCESPRTPIVVIVTATPAAPTVTTPVSYCQNDVAAQLTATGTGLLWYTAATGGAGSSAAPTPTTGTIGSTTYYVSQTVSTCESPRAAIVVNVTAPPAAPTVTTPVIYCQGATATQLTATGTTLLWYTAATGGTGSTTAPTPITTATGSTTYYVSQTSGTCESPRAAITVTVNPTPAAPTVTTPVAYCQNATATPLTATGTGLLWYTTATGGTGSTIAPTPSTATTGSTTYYVSQTTGTCEGPRAAIVVDVTATPAAPTVTTPVSYCQNDVAAQLTATGTGLLWYTAATGGAGSSAAPTPTTGTIGSTTYYVSQTVSTCESPRAAIVVNVTAPPAAPTVTTPVIYCQGATATQLTATGTTLLWYTAATGGTGSTTAPTPITTATGSTTYYVSQTSGTCESPRAAITVTVNPTPAAPTVTTPVAYCQNATATPLTATGTGLLWYTAATGGTGNSTAPIPSTATPGSITYYVSQTTGTCEGPRAAIVVDVTATPAAPTVTSPVTYCQGATATALTAAGTGLLWYTTATGGTGDPNAPTPITTTAGNTTYYVSQSTGTCEGPRAAIVVTINTTPAAPTVTTPVAYCQNTTAVPLTATGTGLLWYTAATGGTGDPNAPTPITTTTGNTTYYVSQSTGTCEGPRAAIVVTINTTPAAPTVTTPVAYCQNTTATPLTATGTGLLWYTAATGGTGNSTAPIPSTATPGSITFYVSQTTGTCEGPRAAIVVDVTATPAAPTVTSPVTYCQGATATALTAAGTGLLWYTTATGGTGDPNAPTPITTTTGNTTYYVSQSTGTCEGPRAAIVVTINTTPAAPTVTTPVAYCQNTTAVPLTATGTGLLWYTTATGGTGNSTAPIPSTATPGSTTYYVSQTTGTCEGPRAAIVVDVTATPAAPAVTTPVAYCQNATATPLTATGTGLLWYTAATGGTGSTIAPMPSTATAGSTTYYVSQTTGTCEGPRAAIIVDVTATPAAPTVTSPVTYCQGATATALTAAGTGLLWYTTATGGTGDPNAPTPITTTTGNTTYYVSQSTGPCEGPRAAIVVTINTTPAAPTVTTPVAYCQNTTAVPLTATGTGLLWYTTATGGTGTNIAPVPSTATGGSITYYVSQTTGTCEGPRAAIVVDVTATPAAPTVTTPVAYCQNTTATPLTATGTGLLWYTAATGGTGNSTAPIPSTATPGSITFYVSQTTGTCEGPRAAIVVDVTATPAAPTVTSPVTYCQGATATALTAAGTGLLWYTTATGGTGDPNAPTPITTTTGNTTYYVSQSTGTCEGPRAAIVVTINTTPAAPTVTTPVAYCQNTTAVPLTATGTGLLWYTTATGGTGTNIAPTPSTATGGSTTYYVSSTTGTCEGPRAAIVVDVTATPAAPIVTSPVNYCPNATATPLTATGTNLLWYTAATGGTGSTTAPTPNTTIQATTTYYVSQSANTCEGPRAAIVVVVNNGLTVDIGKDTTICQGLSVKFTPVLSIPGTSFQWRSITPVVPNSTIDTLTILNAKVSPVDTAQYVLRVTAGGCATEDTVKVNVIWKPIVNAGPSAVSICLGDSILLVGSVTHTSGPIDSLVWTPTDSLTTPVSNQTWAHPVNNTYYHLTAYTSIANYGCVFTPQAYDSIKVVIPAPVIAFAGHDTIAVKGQPHQLLGSGGVSYTWSSPTATISNPLAQNPFVTLYNDANFSVIVKNAIGCADTAHVFVQVLDGPEYYVPNAFSPNGDGLNDVFRAIPAGMANTQYFKVMNRYGETVFETNQYLKGWDGTFKGKKQPIGVYVWIVKGQDKDGKVVEKKGTVMLVQ